MFSRLFCIFVGTWLKNREIATAHNRSNAFVVGGLEHAAEYTCFLYYQLSPSLPAGIALKREDILVCMDTAADTTGWYYQNTDLNAVANDDSSLLCNTHCVFNNSEHNWGLTSSLPRHVSC